MARTPIDLTVFDLDNTFLDIRKQKPDKHDKKEAKKIEGKIERAEQKIRDKNIELIKQKEEKSPIQRQKSYYTRKLKNTDNAEKKGLIEFKLEDIDKKLFNINKQIDEDTKSVKDKTNEVYELKQDKNQLLNKPFSYIVRDSFNKPYELKAPRGTSDEETTKKILKRYIKGIEQAYKKTTYKSGKLVRQSTKDKIKFLLENAKYNLNMIEDGYSEEDFETEDINGSETMPIKVSFIGRIIEINF